MVCQLEIIGRLCTKYLNGLPITSYWQTPDALHKRATIAAQCKRLRQCARARLSYANPSCSVHISCASKDKKSLSFTLLLLLLLKPKFKKGQHMTKNRLMVAFDSKKGPNSKVVKWSWKLWNRPILMHINDKQCEIIHKNQWKNSNFQIQCFYMGTSGALNWKRRKTQKLGKLEHPWVIGPKSRLKFHFF